MTPLHPERLPTASPTVTGPAPVTTSTRSAQRRGTLTAGRAVDAAAPRRRTARTITAKVTRAATSTAARTASATAKAAASGARAASARTASTWIATARTVAAGRAVDAGSVPTPRGGRHAAPTTPAGTAGAGPARATWTTAVTDADVEAPPGAAVPAPRGPRHAAPRTRRAPARTAAAGPEPATAAPATAEPAAAEVPAVVAPAPATAARRPTPYPRTVAGDRPPVDGPPVVPLLQPLGRRVVPGRRRPVSVVAALATVIGIGGGLSAVAPRALADTEATAASTTVSVAEQLGITAEPASPVVDAETTDRLGDLVASRAQRDAEQTRAARVQAKADRAAAVAERRAAAAAAEAARPKAVFPVRGARLTSSFGARWGTLHAGIDLAAPMHTPEYAVMDGVVLEAGPASGYGLAVYLQHRNGDVTVYGHMDRILVSAGQVVEAGDTIALLGNTGQSTGPHLHFEVHQGGLDGPPVDPLPWLCARGLRL